MSTHDIARQTGRLARRLTLAAVAGALTVTLVPAQATAAGDSVTITSPTDGAVLSMDADWQTPTVTEDPVVVTFDAEGSPVTCALDDQAPVACTSPVSFAHVAAGEHHVTVSAGSVNATSTFTVQTAALAPPPVWPVVVDGPFFPAPRVKARWKVGAHRTWVRLLELRQLPRHARVRVTCKGAGCPAPHRFSKRASGRLVLTRHFRGHGLRPGTRIVLRVFRRGDPFVTFRYTMRSNARPRLVVR